MSDIEDFDSMASEEREDFSDTEFEAMMQKDNENENAVLKELTVEKLQEIVHSAVEEKSFNGFRSLIAAFRSAVRASAGLITEKDVKEHDKIIQMAKNDKKKAHKKQSKKVEKLRAVKTAFQVDDPEVFSLCVQEVFSHAFSLLSLHSLSSSSSPLPSSSPEIIISDKYDQVGAPPSLYPRWSRIRLLTRSLFTEILCFLDMATVSNEELLTLLLQQLSVPSHVKWVIPFGRLSERLLSHLSRHWVGSNATVRLHAFLSLQAILTVVSFPSHTSMGEEKRGEERRGEEGRGMENSLRNERARQKKFIGVDRVESIIVNKLYRYYVANAVRSNTWRGKTVVTFLNNSLIELLSYDEALAYRVAYKILRQLSLITRYACSSQYKVKEKHKRVCQEGVMYTFSFQNSCELLVRILCEAVEKNPQSKLKELFHITSVVIISSMKTKMLMVDFCPFILSALKQLNDLISAARFYLPLSHYYIKIFKLLSQHYTNIKKSVFANTMAVANNANKKVNKGANKNANNMANNAVVRKINLDYELCIKLKSEQTNSINLMENMIQDFTETYLSYLSLVAGKFAFPEVFSAVLKQIRDIKFSGNESIKKKYKTLHQNLPLIIEHIKNSRREENLMTPSSVIIQHQNLEHVSAENQQILKQFYETHQNSKQLFLQKIQNQAQNELLQQQLTEKREQLLAKEL